MCGIVPAQQEHRGQLFAGHSEGRREELRRKLLCLRAVPPGGGLREHPEGRKLRVAVGGRGRNPVGALEGALYPADLRGVGERVPGHLERVRLGRGEHAPEMRPALR